MYSPFWCKVLPTLNILILVCPHSSEDTKRDTTPIHRETMLCGPSETGNVPDLRALGLKFRILCLKGSVIALISPCLGGSFDPV